MTLVANGQHHAVDSWRRDTFAPGTPPNATITERRLWAVNPQDYEWRSQFLHEIPDWLAGYFGNRYEKLFTGRDGRRRANTFLRKTIGENVLPRLRKVAARYQLAADVSDLPFGKSLQRLPSLDRTDLKKLSGQISGWIAQMFYDFTDTLKGKPKDEREMRQRTLEAYRNLCSLSLMLNNQPPYWAEHEANEGHLETRKAESGILRLMAPEWWYQRLNPDKDTPVYSAVPLPVPMAGNDSGMFQFPPEGTLVEIAFTGGRPDKPFVRQTVPDGTSLPDIQPGEQLQQQRAEVSQRVTQAGDWVRQTDQTISETSMARVVKADTEQRELVSRETTVKATDKITVLGTSTLLAGAIQQVCTGDYSQAVNNRVASIGGNDETDIAGSQTVTTGKDLIEKIGQIRKSVAAVQQQIIAPVVWIGSSTINVAQLMLDTLDVVKELAEQTASHTHSNTGAPTNAGAIRNTGTKADTLNGKYSPVIGK